MLAKDAGKHGRRSRIVMAVLLTALTACADTSELTPLPPTHDAGDRMFLALVAIAKRTTLPTQGDATLLIQTMDQIQTGNDGCARWKLDQILIIGMPLLTEAMESDQAGQQKLKIEVRRKLHDVGAMEAPDDLCHGHGFPLAQVE